jgi:hypothetical protein
MSTQQTDSAEVAELRAELNHLYDMYRTALLNRKYYGHRLVKCRAIARWTDIGLALAAASTVGAWAVWQTPLGQSAWQLIGALAVVLAVAKPFLNLPADTERYSRLFTSHGSIYSSLGRIVSDVERLHAFGPSAKLSYAAALERFDEVCKEDDPAPSRRLLKRCFDEVKKELPPSRFWVL